MTHGVDEYYFFRVYCEKKNINLQYCDALIDFLKNHEGIYEPQDVSFPVLDKFLTYWFIRVYLNYNQKTVDEIINLVGEFIRWNCLSYSIEDIDKLNDIKKDLVHVMLISDKVPDLKTKINLPKILFADNYWAKQLELDFKGNGEYLSQTNSLKEHIKMNLITSEIIIEKFSALLDLAYRQKAVIYSTVDFFKNYLDGFTFKKFLSGFLVIAELFGSLLFDAPTTPKGATFDPTGYTVVFCDDFDGDSLDTDIWHYRIEGERRGGFMSSENIEVRDGNLILNGNYKENGEYGSGWYSGMVALKEKYNQGYYEIRCKCNKGSGFWSAFWIQADNPYDHFASQGGIYGAELDIFESWTKKSLFGSETGYVTQTIHCNGYDDDVENIDSRELGRFKPDKDMYDEYNTYGLEWTEDEYIFYINGIESARSSFGNGVSQVPEEVIISLELHDSISEMTIDYSTQMIVDYVKIMQK